MSDQKRAKLTKDETANHCVLVKCSDLQCDYYVDGAVTPIEVQDYKCGLRNDKVHSKHTHDEKRLKALLEYVEEIKPMLTDLLFRSESESQWRPFFVELKGAGFDDIDEKTFDRDVEKIFESLIGIPEWQSKMDVVLERLQEGDNFHFFGIDELEEEIEEQEEFKDDGDAEDSDVEEVRTNIERFKNIQKYFWSKVKSDTVFHFMANQSFCGNIFIAGLNENGDIIGLTAYCAWT